MTLGRCWADKTWNWEHRLRDPKRSQNDVVVWQVGGLEIDPDFAFSQIGTSSADVDVVVSWEAGSSRARGVVE